MAAVLSVMSLCCPLKLSDNTGAALNGMPFSVGLPQPRAVAAPWTLLAQSSPGHNNKNRQRGIYA
jgi:hypothetical protein